jgi:hypothetical protein
VAEMFGRKIKTIEEHIRIRKITSKISYVGVAAITINFLIAIAY